MQKELVLNKKNDKFLIINLDLISIEQFKI